MPNEKRSQRPDNLPALPSKTLRNFQDFEKFLDDDANLSATSYYISSFPMLEVEKGSIGKFMPRLMSNLLATHFNFDGKGDLNKKALKLTKLWSALQEPLLLKWPKSRLTADMRSWLRNALGRYKNECSRKTVSENAAKALPSKAAASKKSLQ